MGPTGCLLFDATVLNKEHSYRIALARWQYSGNVNANRKIDDTKGKAPYKQV